MIFSAQVKRVAVIHLHNRMKSRPSILKAMLTPAVFDKWVTKCTLRCNELDMMNMIRSQHALEEFIKDAVVHYGNKVLDHLEGKKKFEAMN